MKFILKLLVPAIAVLVAAYILPGVAVASFGSAIVVAIVLAILNNFVKPILTILTIPITLITLGLFLIILDALIILLAGSLVSGFHVNGLLWAIIFSVLLSIISTFLESILGD